MNFPKFYTDATGKELILGLLSRNPSERFSEDITKIKNMVFYNDFDWDALSKKTISVPFRIKSKIEYQKINANLVEYIESEQ